MSVREKGFGAQGTGGMVGILRWAGSGRVGAVQWLARAHWRSASLLSPTVWKPSAHSSPCLEHTSEYFLDPYIGCSLLTMAWRGYPHGGLRRRRANDTDPPPFCRGLEWGTLRLGSLRSTGSCDTRPVARARLRPTGQALAVKPPLAWTLCKACARRAARAYAAQELPGQNASARATGERRQPVGAWFNRYAGIERYRLCRCEI